MGSDRLEWYAKQVRNKETGCLTQGSHLGGSLPNSGRALESELPHCSPSPHRTPCVPRPMFHQKWGLEQGRQAGQNPVTFKWGMVETSIPAILLPQPPECWVYGHAPPHPALCLLQPSLVILMFSRRLGHMWIKDFGGDLPLIEFYRKVNTITDILRRVKTS